MEFSLQRLSELSRSFGGNQSNQQEQFNNLLKQHEPAIDKCSRLLFLFKNSKFIISLIFVGLIEENKNNNLKSINFSETYDQLDKLCNKFPDNKQLQTSKQNLISFIQTIHKFNPILQTKKSLQFEYDSFSYRKSSNLSGKSILDDDELLTTYFNEQSNRLEKALISLNCVVVFDAILNPKSPSTKLAFQLYRIAVSNHLKYFIVCSELIKCSLVNFVDSLDQGNKENSDQVEIKFLNQFQHRILNSKQFPNKENKRWASFIYLKLPSVLKSLKQLLKDKNESLELEKGLERLINFTPLLELIDFKTDCDCLKSILSRLVALQLIDEQFQQNLLNRRDEKFEYFNNLNSKIDKSILKNESHNLVMIQGQILLGAAEKTANSTLATLSPEIASKPENLLNVLVNLIGNFDNSIEIVLNILLCNGKLGKLIKRMIHFNDLYTTCNEENSKQAILRNNLFDYSFLILNYIIQEHGQEIIFNCLEEEGIDLNQHRSNNQDDMEVDDEQNSLANSFFVKFCLDYLPENLDKVNYEEKFKKDLDQSKVDCLLGQFQNDNFDYQMIKWNEVLLNSIGAFKELLQAYLNDCIKFDDLAVYLVNMIKRNCSIGLVISFYAINQLSKVPLEEKKKIVSILNYISNGQNFAFCFNNGNQNDVFAHYKEKYTLASNLIKNLMKEQISNKVLEVKTDDESIGKNKSCLSTNEINNPIELYRVLKIIFKDTIKRGWLNNNSIYCFDKILCVSGANWFMDKLVKLLLYECEIEKLEESVELVFGLSNLDIEQCCFALLNVVVPQYLVNSNDQSVLIEPRLLALSKLISSILYSILESDSISSKLNHSFIRRSSSCYLDDNFLAYENELNVNNGNFMNENFENGNKLEGKEDIPAFYLQDPSIKDDKSLLIQSISSLLRLASSLLNKQKISQRTNFSLILLEQLIFTCSLSAQNSLAIENRSFNVNSITNNLEKIIASSLDNNSQIILQYLPFDTSINLVRIFANKLNYEFLLSIGNLQSNKSRKVLAKSICQLYRTNYQSF